MKTPTPVSVLIDMEELKSKVPNSVLTKLLIGRNGYSLCSAGKRSRVISRERVGPPPTLILSTRPLFTLPHCLLPPT